MMAHLCLRASLAHDNAWLCTLHQKTWSKLVNLWRPRSGYSGACAATRQLEGRFVTAGTRRTGATRPQVAMATCTTSQAPPHARGLESRATARLPRRCASLPPAPASQRYDRGHSRRGVAVAAHAGAACIPEAAPHRGASGLRALRRAPRACRGAPSRAGRSGRCGARPGLHAAAVQLLEPAGAATAAAAAQHAGDGTWDDITLDFWGNSEPAEPMEEERAMPGVIDFMQTAAREVLPATESQRTRGELMVGAARRAATALRAGAGDLHRWAWGIADPDSQARPDEPRAATPWLKGFSQRSLSPQDAATATTSRAQQTSSPRRSISPGTIWDVPDADDVLQREAAKRTRVATGDAPVDMSLLDVLDGKLPGGAQAQALHNALLPGGWTRMRKSHADSAGARAAEVRLRENRHRPVPSMLWRRQMEATQQGDDASDAEAAPPRMRERVNAWKDAFKGFSWTERAPPHLKGSGAFWGASPERPRKSAAARLRLSGVLAPGGMPRASPPPELRLGRSTRKSILQHSTERLSNFSDDKGARGEVEHDADLEEFFALLDRRRVDESVRPAPAAAVRAPLLATRPARAASLVSARDPSPPLLRGPSDAQAQELPSASPVAPRTWACEWHCSTDDAAGTRVDAAAPPALAHWPPEDKVAPVLQTAATPGGLQFCQYRSLHMPFAALLHVGRCMLAFALIPHKRPAETRHRRYRSS